jgi:hypothetical protein
MFVFVGLTNVSHIQHKYDLGPSSCQKWYAQLQWFTSHCYQNEI